MATNQLADLASAYNARFPQPTFPLGDPRTTPQLFDARESFNTGFRRRSPPSFATTPSGASEMDALRAKLRASVDRTSRDNQLRRTIQSPAVDPYGTRPIRGDATQAIADMLLHMAAHPADNPLEQGGRLSTVQGLPNDPILMAMPGPPRTPSLIPSSGPTPHQAAAIDRFNQINAGGAGLPTYSQAVSGELDCPVLGPYAGGYQKGFDKGPDVGAPASAGLMPELADAADAMSAARNAQSPNFMDRARVNPKPPSYGTPSPARAAQLAAERAGMRPPNAATLEQLKSIAPGLRQQAGNTPYLRPPTDQRLSAAPGYKELIAAEKARDSLPADQQEQIQLPTLRGNYTGAPTGVAGPRGLSDDFAQKVELFNRQNANPMYQAMMNKRDAQHQQALKIRTGRVQDERAIANGMDPDLLALTKAAQGGGQPVGQGAGGMNFAQAALAARMNPEAAGAIWQGFANAPLHAAQAQAAVEQARIAAQQADMQKHVIEMQEKQAAQQADAALPDTLEGDKQRVIAAGGFDNLPLARQRHIVTRTMNEHANSLSDPAVHAKLQQFGVDPSRVPTILGGVAKAPQYNPGLREKISDFIGALVGETPRTQAEAEWRRGAAPQRRGELPLPGASAVPRQAQ